MAFGQFPVDDLNGIGGDLRRIESVLAAPSKSAEDVAGLGSGQQVAIAQAIEDFHTDWATSVTQLLANIGGFGDASSSIAASAVNVDEAGAALFARSHDV